MSHTDHESDAIGTESHHKRRRSCRFLNTLDNPSVAMFESIDCMSESVDCNV